MTVRRLLLALLLSAVVGLFASSFSGVDSFQAGQLGRQEPSPAVVLWHYGEGSTFCSVNVTQVGTLISSASVAVNQARAAWANTPPIGKSVAAEELPVYQRALTQPVMGGAPSAEEGLSGTAQSNLGALREWAQSQGWTRGTGAGPETLGEIGDSGQFEWRLKLKLEGSTRPGLEAGSWVPRFDARLGPGDYLNPFTGELGGREIGTHLPLDYEW